MGDTPWWVAAISTVLAGISGFFGAVMKAKWDAYKAKQEADVARIKVEEEAKTTRIKLEQDGEDRVAARYEKIIEGIEARLGLERTRWGQDVQRLEARCATLESRNDECEKSNQYLKNQIDVLERKQSNLERRADSNTERIGTVEKKVANGGGSNG